MDEERAGSGQTAHVQSCPCYHVACGVLGKGGEGRKRGVEAGGTQVAAGALQLEAGTNGHGQSVSVNES